VLSRAVPFDGHAWLLTDPVSQVGTSPHAHVPGLPWSELPAFVRDRYLMDSVSWHRRLADLGLTGALTAVFDDRFGRWGWLDLWRSGGEFDDAERALLAQLCTPLTEGLRAAQARTFVEDAERVDLPGPAVVLLGRGLEVVTRTATAGLALHELNPPGDAPVTDAIPAAAINVGAALMAAEAGQTAGPAWSRVHLGGGSWVTLRAERLTDGSIAVTIETSTPAERREVFALAHGLTPREREVLGALTTGADSRSMGRTLALSEHTVNDHVRAVLAKTGSPTRQVLLSRIAGS
jgi:DNA-binding CsgD family transcriptional regulator